MIKETFSFNTASARLVFYAYLSFSLLTVVGGFLTAPVMTWYFYGDWRFWRHMGTSWKLFFHGWKMIGRILQGDNNGFLLAVPLGSPEYMVPVKDLAKLNNSWEHKGSCGPCTRCCSEIKCPVMNIETGLCRGYGSFFWRYFNCGRYPSTTPQIEYYGCPKWVMVPGSEAQPAGSPNEEPLPEG